MKRTQIIGITGSISMGKSTLAGWLEEKGYWVSDADKQTHFLLQHDAEIHEWLQHYAPQSIEELGINRTELGRILFPNPPLLRQFERLMHPKVRLAHLQVIHRACQLQHRYVVLDVPLLFESGSDALCDQTILATAPLSVQQRRVLQRPNMTLSKLQSIRRRQWSEAKKAIKATTLIQTGLRPACSKRQLYQALSIR